MKLYHGSTVAVKNPSLQKGRSNADFGKGFYTTSSKEQTVRWANIKKERKAARRAVVSVFEFDDKSLDSSDWKVLLFTGADADWLSFVTDCRKSRAHDYDVVLGPVADDKVFTTVNLFESGVLSAEAAILELKAYKTYDQFSFHTDKALKKLRFLEAFEVDAK